MGAIRHDHANPQSQHCSGPYADELSHPKHAADMLAIAEKTGGAVSEVSDRYAQIFSHLREHARVRDFLTIFVPKKVFEQLMSLRQ
jgi:NAD-specific glutamate dehydrogenase